MLQTEAGWRLGDPARLMRHRLSELCALLGRCSFRVTCEADLQRAIAGVLERAGLEVVREVELGDAGRVDLLLPGGAGGAVGIEVKIAGSAEAVLRQVARYAASGRVGGLLVASSRVQATFEPCSLSGVPVASVWCRRGLGGGV